MRREKTIEGPGKKKNNQTRDWRERLRLYVWCEECACTCVCESCRVAHHHYVAVCVALVRAKRKGGRTAEKS